MTGLPSVLPWQALQEGTRPLPLPELLFPVRREEPPTVQFPVRREEPITLQFPVLREEAPRQDPVPPPFPELMFPVEYVEPPRIPTRAEIARYNRKQEQIRQARLQAEIRADELRRTVNAATQAVRQAATIPPQPSVELPVTPICQGDTNGCGTTSLAMCLNHLHRAWYGTNGPYTRERLDEGNREGNGFSAPHMLARVARDNGFYASIQNNSNYDEIRHHLDNGRILIALINAEGGGHYVVIHGYRHSDNMKEIKLIITDPATGTRQEIRMDHFCLREGHSWNNLRIGGHSTGINRLLIVLSNRNDVGPDRGVTPTMFAGLAVNEGTNAVNNFAPGGNSANGLRNLWNAGLAAYDLFQGNMSQLWSAYNSANGR